MGALVLILAIYAALKSSCPFIYVSNGEEYVFSGELYPGNIIKNAQETDYLPLPALQETDGKLNIRITNELLEIQHTDLAQLMEVSHPKNTRALADKKGQILLYSNLESPVNACSRRYDKQFRTSTLRRCQFVYVRHPCHQF